MAKHLNTGKQGELLALCYLREKGYTILHTNWRHSYYEIDIIAFREEVLHFIEIKTRTDHSYGYPEESVSTKKLKSIMNAAEMYLLEHTCYKKVQYDILSISLNKKEKTAYFFIEDVYLYDR